MAGRQGISWTVLAVLLAGCNRTAPEFRPYLTPRRAVAMESNGYADYIAAAQSVESKSNALDLQNPKAPAKLLDRTAYDGPAQKAALAMCEDAIKLIRGAASKRFEWDYVPVGPFSAPPYAKGWRLIGRCMAWKIQKAVNAGDDASAINWFGIATTYGFRLTQGGTSEASLGLVIANEARQAIVPRLPAMSPEALRKLADTTVKCLEAKGTLENAMAHEGDNMIAAVDYIQEQYQKNDLGPVLTELGPPSREAVTFLQELNPNSPKRKEYFDGFAAEAQDEEKLIYACARKSGEARTKLYAERDEQLKKASWRPWKRFSMSFFSAGRSLLSMNDECLARTRLLGLEALLRAEVIVNKTAPASLGGLPTALRQDPYTGKPFFYRVDGRTYHIYSAGENFKDDAGLSDDSDTSPDLLLEKVDKK
ncbi:MAG: hypothetical protein JSS72_04235 [Armatimonadetes bacterium]|nr:hypothetical protein [Armatimonadota bacterium]